MFTLPKRNQAIISAARKANYVSNCLSWIKPMGGNDFVLSEKQSSIF